MMMRCAIRIRSKKKGNLDELAGLGALSQPFVRLSTAENEKQNEDDHRCKNWQLEMRLTEARRRLWPNFLGANSGRTILADRTGGGG